MAVLQDAHVVLQALWGHCLPVPLVAQHQDVGSHLPEAGSLRIDVPMRPLCRDRQTQMVSVHQRVMQTGMPGGQGGGSEPPEP